MTQREAIKRLLSFLPQEAYYCDSNVKEARNIQDF